MTHLATASAGREPGSSTLERLRAATRDVHRHVENHPVLRPLATGAVDRAGYRRALAALLGFYRGVDAHLDDLSGSGGLYVKKTAFLRRDLADLGAIPDERWPWSSPLLPRGRDAPAAMGIAYVGEGATRGGRVIGPCVAAALDLGPAYGARFFHLADDERWGRLCAALEAIDTSRERERAARVARATFLCLARQLDRVSPEPRPRERVSRRARR